MLKDDEAKIDMCKGLLDRAIKAFYQEQDTQYEVSVPNSYANELLDKGWGPLPKECPLEYDTEDACAFALPSGGSMGVNRNVETIWRDRDPQADIDDLIPDDLKPD